MSYLRAEDVLPKELIETIQHYINGKSIYIPCTEKKAWGSCSDTKSYYEERNSRICSDYHSGISVKNIATKYSLSEKSIYRILKAECES